MKKETLSELLLWGLVAYSVVVLAYFTLKIFNHDANFISAFGSIFSAIAAFFTAFVAIYLFSKWKKQAIYLDGIKVIKEINIEIKNIFLNLDNLRRFHDYNNQYRDLAFKLRSERKFSEHHLGLMTGEEKLDEILKFKEMFISVDYHQNNLKRLFDELEDLTNQETKNYIKYVDEILNSIKQDFIQAYTLLMQYWVGIGTIDVNHTNHVTSEDILFINSVLGNQIILTQHLSHENIEKYKYYFKTHDIPIDEGITMTSFTYNDVMQDRKESIFRKVKDFRNKHLE